MMVMTAKVNLKKAALLLGALALAVIGLIALLGGRSQPTGAAALTGNEARVQYLQDLGWQVESEPVESGRVRIPAEESELFRRYALLQESQGFDLGPYAGKTVMRYVYRVTNAPNATDPVYATLLTDNDRIIGGDITDTGPKGKIQGLKPPTGE